MPDLVLDDVGDEEQVEVGDAGGEARVLADVEVLVGDRGDHLAQRLGEDHQRQPLVGGQPDRAGRLGLAARQRLNAAAHDLGDERRGVDRQPQQQRGEFGEDAHPLRVARALNDRTVDRDRHAEQEEAGQRQGCEQAERPAVGVAHLAGLALGDLSAAAHEQRRRRRADQRRDPDHDQPFGAAPEAAVGHRPGDCEAAVGEKGEVADVDHVLNRRQPVEHDRVPEHDLHEQRGVAEDLDEEHRQPRDEPVGGEPRDADRDPQHGREHHRQQHDADRGPDAHEVHREARVGRAVDVGQPLIADVERGRLIEEAEAVLAPAQLQHDVGDHEGGDAYVDRLD